MRHRSKNSRTEEEWPADVRGRRVRPLSDPQRLVSLVPSTTETVFALGLGEALVGYTRFCVHPAEQVTREHWIGGTKNPKIDRIIARDPQLVFANREENREEDVAALEAAGISVWVAEPHTVEDAVADIRAMGRLLGQPAAADDIATSIEVELVHTYEMVRRQAPWRFVYYIWRDPWMTAGDETFIHGLLTAAGGVNCCAGRYPEVPPERLPDLDPDVLLLSSEPFPFAEEHADDVRAIVGDTVDVRLVDGELLSWHGVRLRDGLPYARRLASSVVSHQQTF